MAGAWQVPSSGGAFIAYLFLDDEFLLPGIRHPHRRRGARHLGAHPVGRLEALMGAGEVKCFIPHSSAEQLTSRCTQQLAGRAHEAATLHTLLVQNYTNGNWGRDVKLPDHPHCTHVVTPVQS